MKTIIYICVLLGLISCSKTPSESFTLEGFIKGANDGVVSLHYLSLKNDKWYEISDTAKMVNGKFSFDGKIKELTAADLIFENSSIRIYLEPSKIKITIEKDLPYAYQLTGTKVEKESIELRKELESYETFLHQNKIFAQSIIDQIVLNGNNAIVKDSLMKVLDSYRNDLVACKQKLNKAQLNFIAKHSTYKISPDILYLVAKSNLISTDTLKQIYNNLPEHSKKSLIGKLACKQIGYTEFLASRKPAIVGNIAADFERKDPSQKDVQLSEFKNKNYVLLDFWASWCSPCIKESPKVKNLSNQYKGKGLVIIGISLDTDKNNWLKAIDKYELKPWIQVLSAQHEDNALFDEGDISDIYNIETIPSYVLIDKQGKILAIWDHIGKEELMLIDKYLK